MDGRTRLNSYIEAEHDTLLRSVELYVLRGGLASGNEVKPMAMDILNEVVVDALKNADRYDPKRQPRPWLMGMVVIVIKRRQSERSKNHRREPLIRDLYDHDEMSDEEIFDLFAQLADVPASHQLDSQEAVESLLMRVSEVDQYILRLAIIHGLKGEMLAQELGISDSAARVRLHRALQRLRQAHGKHKKANHHV